MIITNPAFGEFLPACRLFLSVWLAGWLMNSSPPPWQRSIKHSKITTCELLTNLSWLEIFLIPSVKALKKSSLNFKHPKLSISIACHVCLWLNKWMVLNCLHKGSVLIAPAISTDHLFLLYLLKCPKWIISPTVAFFFNC